MYFFNEHLVVIKEILDFSQVHNNCENVEAY